MKLTIDIPDGEIRDLMCFTKAGTKREAVLQILKDDNRRQRMADLVKYSGTCRDMMSLEELMEVRERDRPKFELEDSSFRPPLRNRA